MSKELSASVASRHSDFNSWKSGLVSVTQLVIREYRYTLEKLRASGNSVLRQAIAVFHPEEVGPILIEFMQELAYVTQRHGTTQRLS